MTCTHQVTLTISGFVTKWDRYDVENDTSVYLIDGDWNDHYLIVEAAPTVKVTTKVIYESSTGEASVEEPEAVDLAS